MKSCYILGMRVDDVTHDEALGLIEGYVKSDRYHRVVTPNPEFAMAARRDPAFLEALNGSSLAIPDGIGLMLAARLAGFRFRQHVRGTDLVHRVAGMCARLEYRMFLLGAEPGVAEGAAARLVQENPRLRIAGTFAGRSGAEGDPETVAAVRAAAPVDVLLVAYGGGSQEKWLVRNQQRAGAPCGIGVGGVFDFLSGRSRRAPIWVRRLELEWLYRLLSEPRRWRRQLALPGFAATVLWESMKGRGPVVEAGYKG